jgi:UDP-4-amino-4-deoxy-L-arabinose formyltransferase/UDP-glucuronic acid dehydrogenase (UDP-4-keto-hexauronic acid decarboxylating)
MTCVVAPDVASDAFDADLAAFAPDVVLVGTFAVLLSARVLAIPRTGAFNLHPSLLPAYRGPFPEFWVLRNGEARTGITLHRMVERADAGDIVSSAVLAIPPEETLGSLTQKLGALASPLVLDLLRSIRAGETVRAEPQDERAATGARRPRPEHLEIRWAESARSIDRLLRACDDYFDATTTFRGDPLVIRSARPGPHMPSLAPGELALDVERSVLDVGTGDGTMRVGWVEIDRRRFDGAVFFAEAGLRPGERLGAA